MRSFTAFLFSMLIGACFLTFPLSAEEGFTPLFNGKNLDGWVIMHGSPEAWSVQDGFLEWNDGH